MKSVHPRCPKKAREGGLELSRHPDCLFYARKRASDILTVCLSVGPTIKLSNPPVRRLARLISKNYRITNRIDGSSGGAWRAAVAVVIIVISQGAVARRRQ